MGAQNAYSPVACQENEEAIYQKLPLKPLPRLPWSQEADPVEVRWLGSGSL